MNVSEGGREEGREVEKEWKKEWKEEWVRSGKSKWRVGEAK